MNPLTKVEGKSFFEIFPLKTIRNKKNKGEEVDKENDGLEPVIFISLELVPKVLVFLFKDRRWRSKIRWGWGDRSRITVRLCRSLRGESRFR